ncbi:MAG: YajQ family cyclic di-GMP-binding protein [Micrococcales bacterium]|nr:YajQ family cyclic di-GMP-binding protein [Micrococcales bacterium]
MAAESSFDVVSRVDHQEVDNALNQAAKEVAQRYDFRGTDARIAWSGKELIVMTANAEERVKAVLDVLQTKLVRRGVSLKALDASEPKQSGKEFRIDGNLKEGLSADLAKKIAKLIRDEGPTGVKTTIMGDAVRVASKSKDQLQSVMAMLREEDFEVALQFTNYR